MRFFILLSCMIIASCSSKRLLDEGDFLLSKVNIESDDKHVTSMDLQTVMLQRPNSKWLGLVKAPLGLYSLAGKKDSSSLNVFLRKIGEPPVIYDDFSSRQTIKGIQNYLTSKGFRKGYATYDTIHKKHKVNLSFNVNCGPRSYIRNVSLNIQNTEIQKLIMSERKNTKLRGGSPFDINKLYEERTRLVNLLQNNGYYHINKEFFSYLVDTIKGDLGVNISLNFVAPLGTDTLLAYTPYRVGKINIYEDCSPEDKAKQSYYRGLTFHHNNNKSQLSRRLFRSIVKLHTDSLYKVNNTTYTNNALNELDAVSFSTISTIDSYPYVDYNIFVRRTKPHGISFDVEGTNTAGDFGMAMALTYTNRNLFRGGEILRLKLRGAYEAITNLEGYSDHNYLEYSLESNLTFPTLLLPFGEKFRYRYHANTEFGIIYNLQDRPEFHRRMVSANFSYKWNKNSSKRIQHKLDVLSLNYIFMPWISHTFRKNYLEGNDPRYGILRYSYENLFIANTGYSVILNSKKSYSVNTVNQENAWQIKFNIESAGNLLNLTQNILGGNKNKNGNYELFGIEFSQYIKADFDFVKNFAIDNRNSLVFHTAFGIAIPYGNSTMIPYEKRYFSGGANSVRGWSVRELGPGSYKGVNGQIDFINQTGNLKLDVNLEYRTYLFWKLYGALFIDAGNIWNTRDYSQSGEKIKWDYFYEDLAVSYGLGLRLNLDYFILRFDGGMKAINPSVKSGRKHYPILCHNFNRDFTFHFAIGLPF